MRIVFMGTPDFAVPALDALAASGAEIAAVYTRPPRRAGRGQQPRPSPVALRAGALGLEVHAPASLRGPEAAADLAAVGPEAAVVVAYGLILPPAVLAVPARGCLNIHASLLPRWRGAAPVARAIMAGDAETGVSIMQMETGLDTGPVLLSEAVAIGPEETAGELSRRLSDLGARLIVGALGRLDALVPEAQDDAGASYAAKIDKAEARIDWSRPAAAVDGQIRGLSPAPGAWTTIGGERVRLLRSRLADGSGAVGEVLAAPGSIAPVLAVACGTGAVEVLALQRAGKGPVAADAFLRGFALAAGTRLG